MFVYYLHWICAVLGLDLPCLYGILKTGVRLPFLRCMAFAFQLLYVAFWGFTWFENVLVFHSLLAGYVLDFDTNQDVCHTCGTTLCHFDWSSLVCVYHKNDDGGQCGYVKRITLFGRNFPLFALSWLHFGMFLDHVS